MSAVPKDTNYPISRQFTISHSPFEDRLVVRAQLADSDHDLHMLLTRRMVMIVVQQLLARLPALTGLEKTPSVYWQEVLRMGHEKALQAKAESDRRLAEQKEAVPASEGITSQDANIPKSAAQPIRDNLYLATELTTLLRGEKNQQQLLLAFKGLPMPDAMTEPRQHIPIFAIPLQADNVHQLLELITVKCNEAQWHLPLDLPWHPENAETGLEGMRRDN
jgi:hypothetical protein